MPSAETLRVGTVPYLVARPLDEGLEGEAGIEVVRRVPARLVEGLRDGSLDVALVSSIELFRRPGYRRIDGLGVCARGSVSSVKVFLRTSWERAGTIALDPASRAAAALVQVLGAQRASGPPRFVETEDDPARVDADGWLRIGDAALREFLSADAPGAFDPAEAWSASTALPFVFATWIVRGGVEIEPWLPAFRAARLRGEARREELCARAAREWSLPLAACRHYLLNECVYEPGVEMAAALREFRDRAARLDLCDARLDPAAVGAR